MFEDLITHSEFIKFLQPYSLGMVMSGFMGLLLITFQPLPYNMTLLYKIPYSILVTISCFSIIIPLYCANFQSVLNIIIPFGILALGMVWILLGVLPLFCTNQPNIERHGE